MCVFEIRPTVDGWRLAHEDDADGLAFPTLVAAERRARWLAVRQEVRGVATEIRIRDADSTLIGAWRAERYEEIAAAVALEQAA